MKMLVPLYVESKFCIQLGRRVDPSLADSMIIHIALPPS